MTFLVITLAKARFFLQNFRFTEIFIIPSVKHFFSQKKALNFTFKILILTHKLKDDYK